MTDNADTTEVDPLFDEQVLRKRPYLDWGRIVEVIDHPVRREVQDDGRIRLWGAVADTDGRTRYLRVVTLADGLTVHNAFFDRNFHIDPP
ncbi:MAG: hypothetical protein JOZ27_04910 [Caulobacteraceae bacterium]|nr:hypothetical protein [Caulobacteraceae bacterium]